MEQLTYKTAFDELTQISAEMESEVICVDELSEKVSRAAVLIAFCQAKLTGAEMEVKQVLSQLERKDKTN